MKKTILILALAAVPAIAYAAMESESAPACPTTPDCPCAQSK